MSAVPGDDWIGKAARAIAVVRDGLLAGLIVVGIAIFITLWPKLKDRLDGSSIESVSLGAVSIKLGKEQVTSFQPNGLTMEAVGGSADILEKGSLQDLAGAEAQLQQGQRRFDLLGVSTGHNYSGELLVAYVSRLAPKFVIFRRGDKFDGWIDAGVFSSQLRPHETYSYERLLQVTQGLHKESIGKSATAREALEKMQALHLDHLAAVDGEQQFQFMLSRDEILSKVVTAVVLSQPAE